MLSEKDLPNGTKIILKNIDKEINGLTGKIVGISTNIMAANVQYFIVKLDKPISSYNYECISVPNTCLSLI